MRNVYVNARKKIVSYTDKNFKVNIKAWNTFSFSRYLIVFCSLIVYSIAKLNSFV